jgi:hypothetical protein
MFAGRVVMAAPDRGGGGEGEWAVGSRARKSCSAASPLNNNRSPLTARRPLSTAREEKLLEAPKWQNN